MYQTFDAMNPVYLHFQPSIKSVQMSFTVKVEIYVLHHYNDVTDCVVFRYSERLHLLLEEERSQRRKSWQLGMGSLEEQQQQLLEAQQSTTEVLNVKESCVFIHRCSFVFMQLKQVQTCDAEQSRSHATVIW